VTGALTGSGGLVRLILRRDRVRLPIWVLAIIGLVYASAGAVSGTYSTVQEIQAYATTMGTSPAAIAMSGPPVALDTVGGIVVNETALTALLGVALMAIFLVIRHTRAEEEEGRTEVLRSTVVGRHAPMAAALAVVAAASVLVGLGVAGSVATLDVSLEGAMLYGAAVAAFGMVMAAVAAVAAQLMTHGRGAVGVSTAVLGLAFLVRAVGDVRGNGLSWLSPMGWSQQVHAFGEPRWWPLGMGAVLAALAVAGAVALANRRDLGSGLVAARPGPPMAGPWLGGPVGLAWRLQRGSVIGWTVGVLLGGAAFGSFSREISAMVESNPELAEVFAQGGGSLVDGFLSTAVFMLALIASGFTVSSALRTRAEETSGRLEPLLATGLSRSRWLASSMLVTLGGTAIVVAAAGLGLGLAHGLVTEDLGAVPRLLGYALVYLPAVLLLAALAVLLFGWVPRAAMAAWAVVAVCVVIGWLGTLLQFPAWFEAISPFTHTPAVPVDALTWTPVVTIAVSVVLAAGAGLVGFRRRDVG
jgi:ABC-2 type transport system permease protein